MAAHPRYWHTVQASKSEATTAIDMYNRPIGTRSFEGFVVHMHIAWTYLLHAEFEMKGIDYRYWAKSTPRRLARVNGDVRRWDLARCARERWDEGDPVRKNIELFIELRNKIEHRYADAISLATAGYAQALVLNYEEELTGTFGAEESVAEVLRFPLFLQSFSEEGERTLRAIHKRLPRSTAGFLARFESEMDAETREDPHFEFRLHLIPKTGPKTEADLALTFVRLDDLTDDQRGALADVGRSGTVIVRERERPVSNLGLLKPSGVVSEVAERINFVFKMHHFVGAWHSLGVRPQASDSGPSRTDDRYCVYDTLHQDYVYTEAFVDKLARDLADFAEFERVTGFRPVNKAARPVAPAAGASAAAIEPGGTTLGKEKED